MTLLLTLTLMESHVWARGGKCWSLQILFTSLVCLIKNYFWWINYIVFSRADWDRGAMSEKTNDDDCSLVRVSVCWQAAGVIVCVDQADWDQTESPLFHDQSGSLQPLKATLDSLPFLLKAGLMSTSGVLTSGSEEPPWLPVSDIPWSPHSTSR